MKGRSTLLAMMAGSGVVQLGAGLPASVPPLAAAAGAGLTLAAGVWLRYRQTGVRSARCQNGAAAAMPSRRLRVRHSLLALAWLLWMVALGASYTAWRAETRLAQTLDERHENLVTRLTLRIDSLAVGDALFQRAEATVLHSPVSGVPTRLRLGWPAPAEGGIPELVPGDVYSAAVVLKRPHGARNPQAFDAEAWMFERGLRARATVRGQPVLLERPVWAGAGVAVERIRHHLRRALRIALGDARYGPVVIALALGDQASVPASDWEVFSRTGIIHLVSISGLHVTLLAGLAGAAALWLWKRGSWRGLPLPEYAPSRTAGAVTALFAAWLYCLVAGWGVPAQRTFFMLATVGVVAVLRLPISASRVLALAAWIILALDPWALMSPGFWLSFGAVAVLMLLGSGRWRRPQSPAWREALIAAAKVQGAMTVALVPMLALQFHEVSLASPLANALAIPVVSFLVTPLALVGMLFSPWP
ncbi:MAG: ComEC/Rec2 family competence protein, partial [Pigmentiphaga sp.]